MPFSPADVFAALAAITAGTIALQVMAQTSHIQPSKTLVESNRRQTLGMLALLSPAVSCMLAIFVWLDRETYVPKTLPYLIVVLALTGINCFIAADAIDRITSIDRNNKTLKIAVARKQLNHYRRRRLPPVGSWSKTRLFVVGLFQIIFLSALVVSLDLLVTEAPDIASWARRHSFMLIVQICLFVSFAIFAWARIRFDRTEQWLSGFVILILLAFGVLATSPIQSLRELLHGLLMLWIPTTIFASSLKTLRNKTRWWVPSWCPGSWVRVPAALALSTALTKAEHNLKESKRSLTPNQNRVNIG